jgi:cytochrome c oxidase subunit 1
VRSILWGKPSGDNPWGASTLEWSTPSPPPPFNFVALPVVTSREPLWSRDPGAPTHVRGLSTTSREGLVTTVLDAVPDVRYGYPSPTIWPFIAAVMVNGWLIWSVYSVQGALWGMIPPAIAFIGWFWPRRGETSKNAAEEKRP